MVGHGVSSVLPTSAPRYREAYPYLDIGNANAAFRRGDYICEFKDQSDIRLGVARFHPKSDSCQFEYDVHTPFIGHVGGWTEFELEPIINGFAKGRVTITCPDCKSQRKVLFLKDKWSCADCHQLLFRSQLIHPRTREWEKFDALSQKLKFGKPHGIRNKTYELLMEELEAVEVKLYTQTRRFASSIYSHIVKTTWRAPVPRDGGVLFSLIADAEAKLRDQLDELKAPPLLRPNVSEPRWGHVLGVDYETDKPEEM